jgi:hypothetical protein
VRYATAEKILWIRKTDAVKAVRQQLVSIAEDEPMNRQNSKELSTSSGVRFAREGRTAGEFAPRDFAQTRNPRLASVLLR